MGVATDILRSCECRVTDDQIPWHLPVNIRGVLVCKIRNFYRLSHQIDLYGHSSLPGRFEEQKAHAIALKVRCDFPITRMPKVNAISLISLWRFDRGNSLASGVR
jgi:hypothetical protein